MPQRDYRAYAASPAGKAARARAHARYIEKRRKDKSPSFNHQPLTKAIQVWRTT